MPLFEKVFVCKGMCPLWDNACVLYGFHYHMLLSTCPKHSIPWPQMCSPFDDMLALQVMVPHSHNHPPSCRFLTGTGYYFHKSLDTCSKHSNLDRGLDRAPDYMFLFLVQTDSIGVASPFGKFFFVSFLLFHKLQNKVPTSTHLDNNTYQPSVSVLANIFNKYIFCSVT